jgi:hypothetical protein
MVVVVLDVLGHLLLTLLLYLKLGEVQVYSEAGDGGEFLFQGRVDLGLKVLNAVRVCEVAKVD